MQCLPKDAVQTCYCCAILNLTELKLLPTTCMMQSLTAVSARNAVRKTEYPKEGELHQTSHEHDEMNELDSSSKLPFLSLSTPHDDEPHTANWSVGSSEIASPWLCAMRAFLPFLLIVQTIRYKVRTSTGCSVLDSASSTVSL